MSASLFRIVCLFCACALFAGTKSHDVKATALSLDDAGLPIKDDDVDDDDDNKGNDEDKDGGVGTGEAGKGGGAAGKGSAGEDAPKTCVVSECGEPPMLPIPGASVSVCCTNDDKCGFDLSSLGLGGDSSCLEQDAPGVDDAECPTVTIMSFITMPGCCRPDGTCGSKDTFLGLGCTFNMDDQDIPCDSKAPE